MIRRLEQFFRRGDISSGTASPLRPTRSGAAFERLEERLLLSAQPVVSLQVGDALIGGQAHVAVTFENQPDAVAGSNIGYVPYVDLIIPHNGADGAGVGNTPVNDGATFVSATLLGTAVTSTVVEFDASGHAVHPFAKDASGNLRVVNASDYGAAAGDQLVVLQLPFGSFVASQPAATVDVTLDISNLADLNTPLPVSAVGGFAYGRDSQDNPTTDAPVVGATATGAITPTLATLTKVYNGPEGETATGPNFPRSWTINFDVAPGQQLTNATLTDLLPHGIVVIGTPTVSGAAGTATYDPVTNHVTVAFTGPITGAAGVDASVTINFYIAENPAPGTPGTPVLDPVTGGSRTLENNVTGQADWVPIDTRDTTQTFVIDEPGPEATVIARSIATQKTQSVMVDQNAAGLGPGDTVEYVLNVQVSDYFDFRNVVLTDLASDGQVYLDGSARIEVSEAGSTTGSGAFTSPNIIISRDPTTGVTTFTFDVSDQLAANGADTDLIGGDNGLGATTFRIVYRTTVESTFAATGLPVGQGDTISNTASVTGDVLDSGGTATSGAPTDGTSSSATIDTGAITKTIYAINGVVVGPGPIEVGAGDLVTFRLTYDLPQTQTEGLQLVDYVPLPIFSVDGVTLTLLDVVSADAPGFNQAKWGPLAGGFDAAQTMAPTVTIDTASNSLTFLFTNLDPNVHTATTADILFTLKVVDGAFGDKLLLTNAAQGTELSSGNTSTATEAIAQLTYNEPELHITKGIVATDDPAGDFSPGAVGPVPFTAPGSAGVRFTGDIDSTGLATTPIDSNLSDVDAGDRVTFALVVENTGSGANGAFDILVLDNLPQGYVIPASGLNLSVTNGAGAALAFTGDLFNGGIRITDPGATTGALSAYAATGGTNVLVITYDLQLTSDVQSRSLITNQAAIVNYAAIEGGVDHVPESTGPVQDTATTQVGDPTVDKTVTATSVAETGTAMGDSTLQDLTVGETITFDITATLREGRIQDFVLQDVLPTVPGQLDYVSAALVSIGSSLFVRNADGSQGAALGTPTIEVNGHTIRFVFAADILNVADNVVNDGDKVVVRLTAVVADYIGNQPGTELENVGSLIYETAAAQTVTLTDTATAEVVGPSFQVAKVADVEIVQGGDIVTYTVDITPVASNFGAPLFDIDLQDVLNQGSLTLVPGSIVIVTGPAGMTTSENDLGGGYMVPAAHIPTLMPGESVRITYQVVVSPTVVAGTTIPNLVSVQGDTIPGVSPTGVERIIAGSAHDTVHVPGPGLIKAVVSTSLPETGSGAYNTTRPDLAIGEEVTYQITVTFPEAVTTDVDVTDLLPGAAGGDASAIFEYVSAAVVSTGGNVTIGGPISFTVDDTNGDGVNDRVVLHLGNVTNAVDGVTNTNDQMVFAVTARVRNAAINQAGEAPVNIAQVDFGTGVTEARAAVDIVEPVVVGGKTASVTHGDAGDIVSYELQVVLSDQNAGPAYDLVATDTVPVGMELVLGSLAFQGFTPAGATLSYDSATRTITATVPIYVSSDPKIVIVYDAVVANTVHPGEVLTNTAQLSFDSQPGSPGPDYERSYGPFTDSAAFTVDLPELSKSVTSRDITSTGTAQLDPNVTDVAVGETVSYLVTLRLPEGQTSLVLTDFAPSAMGAPLIAGDMEILEAVVVSIGGNITGSSLDVGSPATLTDGNGDGIMSQASWNFGNVTNVADNQQNDGDLIVVAIRARVVNNASNEAGDNLLNTAQAQYTLADNSTALVTATAPVEIVAPKLDIAKDASIATGDAGDVVTYTVTINHDALSTSTAYGLDLTDALGPGLQLVAGSVTASLAGATVVLGNGTGDTSVEVQLAALGFPGTPQTLVITYQARLTDSVRGGDTLPNTATIAYQSAPTGFVEARPDTASDDASVAVVFPVALDKTVVATSLPETGSAYFDATLPDLAVGETVTYEIRVTLGEGTQKVLVGDTLPAGLVFVSGEVVSIGAGISNTSLNAGDAPTVSGSGITFDFGNNVVNTGDNVLDAGDVIVLRVVARVAPGQTAATVLTNAATFEHDTGTLTDNAPVEVVAPVVTITKTPSVTTGDAGDVVTFTVVIAEGAGASAPLYDLSAQDVLPAGYELVAGSATASRGTVSELAGGTIRLDLSGAALLPTDDPGTVGVDESRITLTYQVRLIDAVQPGQVITNTIAYTGESAPGAAPGTAQEYSGQADATMTVLMPVQLDKTIVATSNADTGTAQFNPALTDLAVGETFTYRIVATLSEGTQTLVISDTLPPGLEILSSSVTAVGAGLPTGLSGVANTGTGQGILFDFGTVVNTGNNVTTDGTVTIEVVARVRDIAGNQAGTTLTNAASVTIASTTAPGAPNGTETATDQTTAEVVAPDLAIVKQVDHTTGDAGDQFTYTVTVTHTGSSSAGAYDVVLEDALDPVYVPVSAVSSAGTAVIVGNTIRLTLPSFLTTDAPVVVTYVVAFRDTVQPGQVVGNTAMLNWDSTPGAGGRADTDQASAADVTGVFTLDLAKTIVATSLPETGTVQFDPTLPDLAEGETVTYRLVATLAEGTQNLVISDTLPAGLGLVSAAVTAVGAGLPSSLLATTNTGTGQGILFDFGTVVNTGNNITTDGTVTIEVVARVLNVPGNTAGLLLTNAANALVEAPTDPAAPGGTLTDNAAVSAEVVTPGAGVRDPVITKANTLPSGDAGDEVTFTVVVQQPNTSTAPVYDLTVTDAIPAGMTLVAGSVTTTRGTVASGNGSGDTTLRVEVAGLALAAADDPGTTGVDESSITITYRARLTDAVQPGQVITNIAAFLAFSAPVADAGGEARAFNGLASTSTDVLMPVQLDKTIVATTLSESGTAQFDPTLTDLSVGETVTYRIVATLSEGTQTLVISDTLPPGLEILSSSVTAVGGGLSPSLSGVANTGTGQGILFDFGTVVNTGDNDTANGTVTIEVVARVRDIPSNQAGTTLANAASVTIASTTAPGAPNGTETATDQVTAEVVAPELILDKQAPPQFVQPGETIAYTVTLVHDASSTAAAYDIVLTDLLSDPNLELVAGTVTTSLGTVVLGNNAGDTTLRIDVPVLALGQSISIAFTARVRADAPGAVTLTNTIDADFDSAAGAGGRPDHLTDGTETPMAPVLTKEIVATGNPDTGTSQFDPTLTDLAVGETVTYHLTITLPQGTTQDLNLADLLPPSLTLLSAQVISIGGGLTAGTPVITISDQTVSIAFGDVMNSSAAAVNANDRIVIEVNAVVADVAGVVAGAQLVNAADTTFTIGGRNGELTTAAPAELVEPELAITKQVDHTTGDAGDVFTYTVTIQHAADSTSVAYDLSLQDVLDPVLVPIDVTSSAGTASIVGGTVQFSMARLATGDAPVVLTYRVRFADVVEPGQVVGNTASLGWDSNPGAGGRADTDQASAANLTAVFLLDLSKTIVATSLPDTGTAQFDPALTDLAVGETVTYRLVATVAEGTQHLVISDALPPGLGLISAGVTDVGAGLPPGLSATTNTGSGQNILFDFGTVVNTGNNITTDGTVTIEIVARVLNVPGNVSGLVLTNAANALVEAPTDPTAPGGTLTDDAAALAEVVTPDGGGGGRDPVITKSSTLPSGDAGDEVTFTVVVQQPGTSTAAVYDLSVADAIPAGMTLIAGSVTTTRGIVENGNGSGDTTLRIEVAGLALAAADDPGTPGVDESSITITYRARLTDAVQPGERVTNIAAFLAYSAPVADSGGEARPFDGLASTTTDVLMPVQIEKSIVATSLGESGTSQFNPLRTDLSVGETVTYRIVATLSEGTQTLVISDALPDGLEILSSGVTAIGAGLPPGLSGVVNTGTGQGILFDFGTVVNTGNNVATDGTVTIEIVARVRDIASNVAGATLTNTASVVIASTTAPGALHGTETATDQVTAEVVTPDLAIVKQVDHHTGDAGDVFTYTITVANQPDATGAAYDIVIDDAISPYLLAVPGSITSSVGTATLIGNRIHVEIPVLTAGAAPVVITYRATFADTIEPGQVVPNTATLDYASAPSFGHSYTDSDSAVIRAGFTLDLSKTVVATSLPETGTGYFNPALADIAAGETVTYQLVATISEGTQHLVVTDTMPAGLVAESARLVSASTGITFGTPVITVTGGLVTFDFGTIVNAGDNHVGDQLVLEVVARRTADPAAGTVLTNTAQAIDMAPTAPGLPGGTLTAEASAQVEAVAAVLLFEKQAEPAMVGLGEPINYTINLGHAANSTASAYDVILTDPVSDAALQLIPGTVVASMGTVISGNAPGDTTIVIRVPVLLPGQVLHVTYQGRAIGIPVPDGIVPNTAFFASNSTPGINLPGFNLPVTGDDSAQVQVTSGGPHPHDRGLFSDYEDAFRRIARNGFDAAIALAGTAEPGASVTLNIRDASGGIFAVATMMADTGGNWVVTGVQNRALPQADISALHQLQQLAGRERDDDGGTLRHAPSHPPSPTPLSAPYDVQAMSTPPAFEGREGNAGMRVTFGGAIQPGGMFTGAPNAIGHQAAASMSAALERDQQALQAPLSLAWNRFALDFAASGTVAGVPGR